MLDKGHIHMYERSEGERYKPGFLTVCSTNYREHKSNRKD